MQISVQQVTIYYTEKGTGAPVLFLHGNPDSADMWNGVIDRLSDQYRCLAIDLPGFGRSEIPARFDSSLEAMNIFIEDAIQALDISEPLHLVMHDFGAHFGLPWAIKHPDKVQSLVIMNTNFFSDYEWHGAAKLLRMPVVGELMIALTNESAFIKQIRKASPALSVDHLKKTYELYPPKARRMALKLYRATESSRFIGWEDELLKLTGKIPTLVVWGDRDPFISPQYAERFGAKEVYHLPEHSHWAAVEAPELVADKLKQFFHSAQAQPATPQTDKS